MNIEKMFERPDVEQLVHAFSLLENEDDIKTFLTDLCTPREICDFAQRLQVARYLDEGEPYVEVQARTGIVVCWCALATTCRSGGSLFGRDARGLTSGFAQCLSRHHSASCFVGGVPFLFLCPHERVA